MTAPPARRTPGTAALPHPADRRQPPSRLARALALLPGDLQPRRTWPGDDGLVVEAVARDGLVAAAVQPGAPYRDGAPGRVRLRAGADPDLPALAPLVTAGGLLLGHRFGRRAVVRTHEGNYAKALRPRRTAAAAARHRRTGEVLRRTGAPLRVPALLEADAERGLLVTAPLGGRSLDTLLVSCTPEDAAVALALAGALGRALEELGRATAEAEGGTVAAALPWHGAQEEVEVLTGAVERAAAWVPLPASVRRRAAAAAERLRAVDGAPVVVAHRDLHDQQVVAPLAPGDRPGAGAVERSVGVLDLDTAARAHPALDPANLVVHLQLRAVEGTCREPVARAAATALLDALDLDPVALAAYEESARVRTACVHAVRPGRQEVALELLAAPSWCT